MSTNEEKRARKAEKRAANKMKRQQRHKDERLEKQGADAAVNDERDILGNGTVPPEDDLDTSGLFTGLDDAPANEAPGTEDAVASQQDDDQEYVPEADEPDNEVSDGVAASSNEDDEPEPAVDSDDDEYVPEPDEDVSESEGESGPFAADDSDGIEVALEPVADSRTDGGAGAAVDSKSDDEIFDFSDTDDDAEPMNTPVGGGDDVFMDPADMTDEQLDEELGGFEPEPERDVVPEPDEEVPDGDDEPIDEYETGELDDVFGDEAMGKAILNESRYRHPLEDPNSDVISRSEDTGSSFREYDSGQEFEQEDDSQDFEEVDTSDDFEEDPHDGDLEFVSETESVEHDAAIVDDAVADEPKKKETRKERKARLKAEKMAKKAEQGSVADSQLDNGESDGDSGVAVDSQQDAELEEVPDEEPGMKADDEPKAEIVKLTRQELKEQKRSDWEKVHADMRAYKLYKKAGNKGPLDRSFQVEETPAGDDAKKGDTPKAGAPVIKKKPNKRGGMNTVIRESVVEAVWPDFLENRNFIVERDGETWGVGLFFDTSLIGGFNKKSKNDESKGGILEALSSGLLKHLVTEKLMDEECIVFIPCTETMSVIDEYSILYNAEYTLCYVNEDGDYELSGLAITASEVDSILMDNTAISDWIREHTPKSEIERHDGEEIIDEVEDDEPVAEEPAPERPEYLEDDDEFNEFDDMYGNEGDEDEVGYDEDTDYNEDLDQIEATEASEEDVVSYDAVTDTIVRTFYSDDLRLEVSTEPFDALFVHKNGFIPFQDNRVELFDKDDSFLGQAISEMVKDYNTQLEGMHYSNIQKLRADYYTLANLACSRIAERYDMDNIDTEVGKIKKGIDDEYALRLSTQEERAHAETNRLDKEWREKLDEVGKAAAEKARTTYTDRFLRSHNDDLAHVMPNIKLADETEYKTKLQELHDTRRHDAAEELDKFVNEIVAKLSEKHAEMMAAENELRDAWAADLRKYVDEHRKDEFARAEALAERQRQRSEADIVKAEMIGSLNKLRSEFATSEANWKNHTEAMQAQHEEELRAKDQLREQRMAEDEQEKNRLKAVIDDLSHQLETLDQVKETEYKTRVTQLENESLSWKSELDHQRAKHKRQNIVSATLAIIAILAALSVGFIGGAYVNLKADRTKAQQVIVNEIDEKLEENSLIEE